MLTLDQVLANSAKRLEGLFPPVKEAARNLIINSYNRGVPIIIVQGLRTIEEQNELYAQGRTKAGQIVTNAKGGYSFHNYGVAIDFALLLPSGVDVSWDMKRDADSDKTADWMEVVAEAKKLGFEWGGDWTGGFVDNPHFEMTFGLTIKDYLAGKRPTASVETKGVNAVSNTVIKERIVAQSGKLKYISLDPANKPYSTKATDVRLLKLDKGKFDLRLVWAKGKTVTQLVKEYSADYGFNFPFFWDGNPVADCKVEDRILNQGYDTPNGAKQTSWHGLRFKNGEVSIGGSFSIYDDLGQNGFLVKTSPLLIDNGNPCWDWFQNLEGTASDIGRDTNGNLVRAQRTFAGVDAGGNLLIGIADGRTGSDMGLTLEEMSLYMQDKGAVFALNGDGGSSTVLADKTGGLNQSQNLGANERPVNHAVLVFLRKEQPTPAPTPTPPAVKMVDGTKDVAEDAWYANAVKQVMSQGLMSVDDSGNFNPDTPVTRAMLAQVLCNLKDK